MFYCTSIASASTSAVRVWSNVARPIRPRGPRRIHTPSVPAFTPSSLRTIRSQMSPPQPISDTFPPPHSVMFNKPPSESAVLIPLMNVNDEPCILLEVRASKMRVHAGDVSCPGGKVDPTDESFVYTALREAREELSLPSENVEILGALPPEYSLGNRSRAWPFVGFVHPTPDHSASTLTTSALPSYPLDSLRRSPAEVAALFPLPLSILQDPARHKIHYFRLDPRRPYIKIRVGDLVGEQSDEAQNLELEAWGLTGWFLNQLAWRVGWLNKLEPEVLES